MTLVIDASVAIKWVFYEQDSDAADALLGQHELFAPSIWLIEAGNAIWRRANRGEISPAEAETRLEQLVIAPVVSLSVDDDLSQALRLAVEMQHPIYDRLYLSMALRLGSSVVTADRRFFSVVERYGQLRDTVRLLGH